MFRTGATLLYIAAAAAAILFSGCSGESEADIRSIEEIHSQEGIPVRVREVRPVSFTSTLSYTSSLSGGQESTASAMISDEVEEVLVQVGDFVEKNQVIISFPADNPSLNYEQARVNFESARTAYQRISTLYKEEGVSQQSYDNARTQYELAKANWDTVRNMKDVKAPLSGYVTRLNVLESDNVETGDPLFTISDYKQLKSTVWVTDREIGRIEKGQRATAVWQGNRIDGRVIQVDMAMDQTRKAFAVKLEFENDSYLVPSGVSAQIHIEVYSRDQALVVEMDEVIESGDRRYVYLAEDGTGRRREIRTGVQEELKLEVIDGLRPGERLITEGLNLLSDGSKIRIIEEDGTTAKR